jgi:flap endonuclease-1
MGISGFTKFYKSLLRKHVPSEYAGKIVLIDAMQKLYQLCIGHRCSGKELTRKDGKSINHLLSIFIFTMKLLEKGILPVFVFDGKRTVEKLRTIKERKDQKIKAEHMYESLREEYSHGIESNSGEIIKYYKRSFSISPEQMNECKYVLHLMGVPYIQCPEEADQQCAVVSNYDKLNIAGVITEDSDVLVFGGTKILKDFSVKDNETYEINRDDILPFLKEKANKFLQQKKLKEIDFTNDNFIDFSIVMGTDYKISSSNCIILNCPISEKYEKLFEIFVLNDCNVEKMINYMNTENLKLQANGKVIMYKIPPDFIENWKNTREVYENSVVIDPKEIDLTFKKPNINKLIKFLCTKNELDLSKIKCKAKILYENYLIFNKIQSDKLHSRSTLKSYQYKYFRNMIKKQIVNDKIYMLLIK